MPGKTLSGQYGDIPQKIVDMKTDYTPMYENPEEINDYYREALIYAGPDAIKFEDEEIRRDTHSTERINLRICGSRSMEVPDHSEAFLGLTDPDPRGTQLEPDMQRYTDQSRFRGRYVKISPDADHSVPGSYRNLAMVDEDKARAFYEVKEHMKIFSTARDNWHNGSAQYSMYSGKSLKENYADDETMKDLRKATGPRADKTAILSNYFPIGWYRTTDNTFKIAKYGKVYEYLNEGDIDVRRNRQESKAVDRRFVKHRGNMVPRHIAYLMKRLATHPDHVASANARMEAADRLMFIHSQLPAEPGPRQEQTVQTARIAKSMHAATRKSADPADVKMLQLETRETARRSKSATNANRVGKEPMSAHINRLKSNDTIRRRQSRSVANYKSMSPKVAKLNAYSDHTEARKYMDMANRKAMTDNYKNPEADDTRLDNPFGDNRYKNRSIGAMGSKYLVSEMVGTQKKNDMEF